MEDSTNTKDLFVSYFEYCDFESYDRPEYFVLDYEDLRKYDDENSDGIRLTEYLRDYPEDALKQAREALSDFEANSNNIHIINYDDISLSIRDLRTQHLNKLIHVEGTVSKSTKVVPKVHVAEFYCLSCHHTTSVRQPMVSDLEYPDLCSNEDCGNSTKSNFRLDPKQSEKINFKEIEIQEPPEDIEGGETPESENFTVYGDIGINISTGDDVSAIGIYKTTTQRDSSILSTHVKTTNIITKDKKFEDISITEEDVEKIKELSDDPDIYEKLVNSVAPHIRGMRDEKEAIVYQLFKGVPKKLEGSRKRGDIHMLMVGDPGVGKSELLRYASNISPRGIMTSGKGASEAGLTASVVKSDLSDEWTLEAGALVLADQGVAAVDELDKMRDSDRASMHEGLEQQTISINKAGINSTLKSRCTLISAANPSGGRWDDYKPISQQIDLEPALISRFDLIFAPKDKVDEDRDEDISTHVIKSNKKGQKKMSDKYTEDSDKTDSVDPDVSPELFRKYISYARKNVSPVLTSGAEEIIQEFYIDIRSSGSEEDAVPMTVRKLESIIRICESVAKIQLSEEITPEHAKRAIKIIKSSLKDVGYDEENDRYDIDKIETDNSATQRERMNKITEIIEELEDDEDIGTRGVPREKIMEKFDNVEESKIEQDISKLSREGEILEPTTGEYKTV